MIMQSAHHINFKGMQREFVYFISNNVAAPPSPSVVTVDVADIFLIPTMGWSYEVVRKKLKIMKAYTTRVNWIYFSE